MSNTLYEVIGVNPNADTKEIEKKCLELGKKYHPQTNPDNLDAAILYKEIMVAFATLRDPAKRAKYDASIKSKNPQRVAPVIEAKTSSNNEGEFTEVKGREIGVWLAGSIIAVPPIFTWFLLKKGYSNKHRLAAFLWMAVWLGIYNGSSPENQAKYEQKKIAEKKANQTASDKPTVEKNINVPSDSKAQYFVLEKGGVGSERTITTKRIGSSGHSYSKRLYNCKDNTVKYLGTGDTLAAMESSRADENMGAVIDGSIAYYVGIEACDKDTNTTQSVSEIQPMAQSVMSQWHYSQVEDPMTGGTTYHAIVPSSNKVEFGFPYQGAQIAKLNLRIDPKYGKDIIFSIERGQILCHAYEDCNVLVRFDDEKAVNYSAASAADNSSETIFIRNYSKFYDKMTKAKIVRISANIYHEGAPVFEFDVSGFDQKQYKPNK